MTSQLLKTLFDLSGRVAVISGGSRGLGLQIAEALVEYGAKVVLLARKRDELEAAAAHLSALGGSADFIPVDLSQPELVSTAISAIADKHQRIDILVNAAGATWGAAALDHPVEAWRKVMDLNVTALFLMTQAVAARCFIPQGGGTVVNLASIEGLGGHHPKRTGTAAYSTSKGAVINMTRALAAEWGPLNIRVNALAPGFFPTKMTASTLAEFEADLVANTPLGRLGGDADLKGAALLLASDASRHITGQVLVVDGGATVI
jgi:NAD(P)-dependent dehydrogenase (short-subunit alcohol dehydrogenase family)